MIWTTPARPASSHGGVLVIDKAHDEQRSRQKPRSEWSSTTRRIIDSSGARHTRGERPSRPPAPADAVPQQAPQSDAAAHVTGWYLHNHENGRDGPLSAHEPTLRGGADPTYGIATSSATCGCQGIRLGVETILACGREGESAFGPRRCVGMRMTLALPELT